MPASFRRALAGALPRELLRVLERVNELESQLSEHSDEQLRASAGGDIVARLAVAREAAVRALGQRPHDSQILGAAALATGRVIEMRTGEGKTLVAALAAFAVASRGHVHVATANDYLAQRDAVWMRPFYDYVGLTVGVTGPEQSRLDKRAAYNCDVTYATARELAFDYLRDTLTADPANRVQAGHTTALVDEIDFILLDEARIPFVITRPSPADHDGLAEAADIVSALDPATDYNVDDAQRTVWLTDVGMDRVEAVLGAGALDDPSSYAAARVQMALRARGTVRRDRDYVVAGGRVHIVDEVTGRILPGRRWTDGLHQAVEAKEGVEIRDDSRPLAQITVRSYFERYEALIGMSGTAQVSHREFADSYKVDVVSIPTHRAVIREDLPDRVYRTAAAKYAAVVDEVITRHSIGQPVLVGTTTVAHSEYLSSLLRHRGVDHAVLNAKHHAEEAAIVAEAGRIGAVTVATNMAGRGVDIRLGGSDGSDGHATVAALGGLCVIGTERHSSRRVDEQLRGRAGRQGDPGTSMFFASLEDDLLVTQGPSNPGEVLENPARPHRAVEVAQQNAESRDFDLRVASHEYDEVLDRHYAELCRFRDGRLVDPGFAERACDLAGTHARWIAQQAAAGDLWDKVQAAVLFATTAEGWTEVLETMHQVRDWVNLVTLGGNYPITEWRRRSDAAVAAMRNDLEARLVSRMLDITIVAGPKPMRHPTTQSHCDIPEPAADDPQLPRPLLHPPSYQPRLVLDWAEGFAGPEFQEVIVMVDPSGGELDDVTVSEDGLTVYLNSAGDG